jgi:hypothetical protein
MPTSKKIMAEYLVDGKIRRNTYYANEFAVGASVGIPDGTKITFTDGELHGATSSVYIECVEIADLQLLTVLKTGSTPDRIEHSNDIE